MARGKEAESAATRIEINPKLARALERMEAGGWNLFIIGKARTGKPTAMPRSGVAGDHRDERRHVAFVLLLPDAGETRRGRGVQVQYRQSS